MLKVLKFNVKNLVDTLNNTNNVFTAEKHFSHVLSI